MFGILGFVLMALPPTAFLTSNPWACGTAYVTPSTVHAVGDLHNRDLPLKNKSKKQTGAVDSVPIDIESNMKSKHTNSTGRQVCSTKNKISAVLC